LVIVTRIRMSSGPAFAYSATTSASPGLEDARVDDLELAVVEASRGVLPDQLVVRELRKRVLVQSFQVAGGRGRVEIVVQLLHVLAVVPLGIGQAEQAFLENRVAPVPQGQGETEPARAVRDAEQPIFAPPVGAAAGMVVRERPPDVAIGRVVFAHGAPLPF
jgi:hypothetical protein